MAKTDNLTDFLTDIADTIRAKKGTTALINPQDFSSEISSIETSGGTSKLPSVIDGSIEVLNEEDFGAATKIRYGAFQDCHKLKEVHIPETVKEVEHDAFYGSNMTNGAEVYYNGTFEYVGSNFGSFKTIEYNLEYYKLNDNLYAIFDGTESSSEESEISINENCEYIGNGNLMSSVTSINIPQKVKSINSISGDGLTSLVIPDSVQYISAIHSSSLTTLTLGRGLKSIREYSFIELPNLTAITYNGTVEQFNNIKPTVWGFTQEIDVVCSDGTVKINGPITVTVKLINTGTQAVDFTPAVTGPFNDWGATAMTQDGNTYTATVTGPSPLAFQINNNGNWNKQINNNNQPFSSATDCTVTANFDEFPEGEYVNIAGTLTEGV